MNHSFTNHLSRESSPYLLQHAHNPINWHAWNDEALSLAKKENKLIIISVGYAACHWCHVMEHESFEDLEVAKVMNDHYVSIKVDREERPDVDHVYMNAVQLMTGSGGWPLNVIALPDSRPVWGGTYFRKEQWISALLQISDLFQSKPEKLNEYATKLEQGIMNLDLLDLNLDEHNFSIDFISGAVNDWSSRFDHINGGMKGAPKFMMPNNYHFLLRYAYQTQHTELQTYVNHTLRKMAYGGVYDQIGGGFSRYSVDDRWHVPHFEKMLYDNAQLVSLYADAYLITKDILFKEVIIETLEFVNRELTSTQGNFFSSLDADSINKKDSLEEGAYYVWDEEDLKSLLKTDYDLFSDYYNINAFGHWEHSNYVLIRTVDDISFLKKYELTEEAFSNKKRLWKTELLRERNRRHRPRLDDKSLTSWNAMMLKGYVDAFRALNEKKYLKAALKNAEFIVNNMMKPDGGLYHNYKNGKSTINGFLEDYACTIAAFLALYEQTLDTKWLLTSRDLAHYAIDHFLDDQSKMFFFTSNEDPQLISRSIEYMDNIIPASNSIMAKNLFLLSHQFENERFSDISKVMLNNVKPYIEGYGSGYSNWLDLMLQLTHPFYEVVIVGEKAIEKVNKLNQSYIPNKLIAGSLKEQSLPLLQNRYVENETYIYICKDKTCYLPVAYVEDALQQLKLSS